MRLRALWLEPNGHRIRNVIATKFKTWVCYNYHDHR